MTPTDDLIEGNAASKMNLIFAVDLAAMTMGKAYPAPRYEPVKETQIHKRLRMERRKKREMRRKSKKANR